MSCRMLNLEKKTQVKTERLYENSLNTDINSIVYSKIRISNETVLVIRNMLIQIFVNVHLFGRTPVIFLVNIANKCEIKIYNKRKCGSHLNLFFYKYLMCFSTIINHMYMYVCIYPYIKNFTNVFLQKVLFVRTARTMAVHLYSARIVSIIYQLNTYHTFTVV